MSIKNEYLLGKNTTVLFQDYDEHIPVDRDTAFYDELLTSYVGLHM